MVTFPLGMAGAALHRRRVTLRVGDFVRLLKRERPDVVTARFRWVVVVARDGPSTRVQGSRDVQLPTLPASAFEARHTRLLAALAKSTVDEHFNSLLVSELLLKDLAKPRLIA